MRNRDAQKETKRQMRALGYEGCLKDCGKTKHKEELLSRVDLFGKQDPTPYEAVYSIIHSEDKGTARICRKAVSIAKSKFK